MKQTWKKSIALFLCTIIATIGISSISVSAKTTATTLNKPSITVMANQKKSQIVYWVLGSKVYHLSRSCRTLARSKKIYSGTIKQALANGHTRVCKVCG